MNEASVKNEGGRKFSEKVQGASDGARSYGMDRNDHDKAT